MPCQVHRTVDGRENVENGRKSTSKLRTVVTLGDAHTMDGAMTGGREHNQRRGYSRTLVKI